MTQNRCCPTCKRQFAPVIQITGKRRQLLLDFLLSRQNGASASEIIDYVYSDDPDGGPDNHNIVSVMVCKINKLLEEQKKTILLRGSGGPGSRYYVIQTES